MKVLGLDISTSNVGICLIDSEVPPEHSVVLAIGYPISKLKGLYVKSCAIQDAFLSIKKEHTIDVIVVEEPLEAFRKGMSSAHTIAHLNRFNGIISFLARTTFNRPVVLCNAVEARKQVGIKLDKKSEIGTKDQVLTWVKSRAEMQKYAWPMKQMKSGPHAGQMREEGHCYDIADSFVVSLWGTKFLQSAVLDESVT